MWVNGSDPWVLRQKKRFDVNTRVRKEAQQRLIAEMRASIARNATNATAVAPPPAPAFNATANLTQVEEVIDLISEGEIFYDDAVCATLGTQQFIWDLNRTTLSPWQPWYMHDGPMPCPGPACKQVAGFTVKFDGLSLVTVHGAGHLVPATRPAQGLEVLRRYLIGAW